MVELGPWIAASQIGRNTFYILFEIVKYLQTELQQKKLLQLFWVFH